MSFLYHIQIQTTSGDWRNHSFINELPKGMTAQTYLESLRIERPARIIEKRVEFVTVASLEGGAR